VAVWQNAGFALSLPAADGG